MLSLMFKHKDKSKMQTNEKSDRFYCPKCDILLVGKYKQKEIQKDEENICSLITEKKIIILIYTYILKQ